MNDETVHQLCKQAVSQVHLNFLLMGLCYDLDFYTQSLPVC